MNIPKSDNGWIVSPLGEVRPALLADLLRDADAAAEGGPREVHQTEDEVRATVAWIRTVEAS